jgi:hypothetical protein
MYKYLPIAQNVQEMMVMLKSLPAYTLVFDYRSNLVDINEPAKHLFKVDTVLEFNNRKDEVFSTPDYVKKIILELKRGKTVRNARTLLIRTDNSLSIVELCACMISGKPDFFLFQLFEISPITNTSLGSFTSYVSDSDINRNDSVFDVVESANLVAGHKNPVEVHKSRRPNERKNKRTIIKNTIQLKKKYRKLTEIEAEVCNLMALNLTIPEIASAINRNVVSVHVIMRKVHEKQKLNKQREIESQDTTNRQQIVGKSRKTANN